MSTYVKQTTYPSVEPTATIYIEGLFGLCFKGEERCTIGMNKQSTHIPEFKIYEWTPKGCEPILDKLPAGTQRVEIKVKTTGTRNNAVRVYDGPSPASSPDRHSFVEYCVDLEGPRGHNQRVKNIGMSLWPRFYIDDGLFCAYRLSSAKFDFKDASGGVKVPLEEVALAIAADIFLEPTESIIISADGTDLVRLETGARYEIGITNLCGSLTGASDFDLHYAALDVAGISPYTLASRTPGAGSTTPIILGHCISRDPDASDRAPCMSVIFGETEDFVD
ncbi:MAG TPA: hypothetical protein VJT15_07930 [Pyrinomonadaceae bacterium]|nr:hypothetical protein [Pyrinomonadaceae bacterium]